ncbi:hypothetical protein FN846DRAFT_898148 [Sphaerosporella brunnea]|uniref:Uncharacterized protein n=1 Tax=Sphaerosporella brunnea TaxID=1250544 RepID=A0A5J5F260_9PEZI|nr:hypothetical protein FN846DRAFT_898148 [Sphaerosporella brunnea]
MLGLQFPTDHTKIQLDIVGLLAIVGESAMADHVQPATNSRASLIPRLVPAPQSFLRTDRPWKLPPNTTARVVGIHSGNYSSDLNYFPNILHGIDELPRFTVRTISITRPQMPGNEAGAVAPVRNITVRRFGPMNVLTIVGMLFFIGLLTAAIVLHDGMALIALVLLALTSSIVSLGSLWSVDLPRRKSQRIQIPNGDVVVIGHQGSFLVVRCGEDIARELYFARERCKYVVGDRLFQVIAATGTFMFMASVVFLANGSWNLQASIGLSYIILNGLYWMAGLLPARLQWDLSGYEVKEEKFEKAGDYTATLMNAIRITRAVKWLRISAAVPETDKWDKWLGEALDRVHDKGWDGHKILTEVLSDAPSPPPNVPSQAALRHSRFGRGSHPEDIDDD